MARGDFLNDPDSLPGPKVQAGRPLTVAADRGLTATDYNALRDATLDLHDRSSGWVSVTEKRFAGGADPTGVADSTSAIQAAINFFPSSTYSAFFKPKGGGSVKLPPGDFRATAPIVLRRGVPLVGSGRESSRIIVAHPGAALVYEDGGVYVPDEIVVRDLSIWQDVAIPATSGAGIEVNGGAASPQSVSVRIENVNVEGTYHGILISGAIGGSVQSANVSRAVSHGVYVRWDVGTPKYATQTTSTSFRNVYAYFGGGDGFLFEGAAYLSLSGCASDANAGYGYHLDTTIGITIHGGAEQNALGGLYLDEAQSTTITPTIVHTSVTPLTVHAITTNLSSDTVMIGGWATALNAATGYGVNVLAGNPPIRIGTKLTGNYAASISNVSMPTVTYAGFEAPTITAGSFTSSAASGSNALSLTTGQRLDLGGGTNDYLYSNGTTIRSPGTISVDGFLAGVAVQASGTNGRFIGTLSTDRGDTSQTLTVGGTPQVQRWATTLTANRTVTLSATGAVAGDWFRVVRTGLGAFTLDVGPGLKTIPSATAAFVDVAYDGSAWVLTGYGTL